MFTFRHTIGRRRRLALATAGMMFTLGGAIVTAPASTAAAAPAAASVSGLSIGATGEAVKTLQQALLSQGITVYGGADGVFGPATRTAVTTFQQSQGLSVTGSVDDATASALGLGGAAPAASSALQGLSRGNSGPAVVELQRALQAAGISVPGGADGIFGSGTMNALKAYQSAQGLSPTGTVDDATAARLSGAPAAPSGLLGLRIGARGGAVKELQQRLIGAGLNVFGGADGVFGVATANALSQFQSSRQLPVNARVDDATLAALHQVAPATTAPAATPAPAANPAFVGLAPGALGSNVKALQQALLNAGITFPGGADGVFGPATANAVKTFQTSQGLPATGQVDSATAAALASPKNSQPAPAASSGFALYGERGDRVRQLQRALLSAGISFSGGADGIFGAATTGAVINFQKARGIGATGVVDAATASALGLTPGTAPAAPSAAGITLAAFPVQGTCYFGDTWAFSRGAGRTHEGVDILAPTGKYVYAVNAGTITKVYSNSTASLTGNGLRLTTSDGTYFFYAHLDTIAAGIGAGSSVAAGQIIGTVGATGNAGTPHLHFEVHPRGGGAVNPYPLVKPIDACKTSAVPAQP